MAWLDVMSREEVQRQSGAIVGRRTPVEGLANPADHQLLNISPDHGAVILEDDGETETALDALVQ